MSSSANKKLIFSKLYGKLSGYPAYNFSYFNFNTSGNGFETGTVAKGKIYTISFHDDDVENNHSVYNESWPEAKDIIFSFKIIR